MITFQENKIRTLVGSLVLGVTTICFFSVIQADSEPVDNTGGEVHRKAEHYRTELFGRKYRLEDSKELAAYIKTLDVEIERSKQEEPLGDAHEKDPLHCKVPKNYIDKKMRRAMEETRTTAMELSAARGEERDRLLTDLYIMSGAIRASYLRPFPGDIDAFEALCKEKELRHPRVGLGTDGLAMNLSLSAADPSQTDPALPSSYWTKPTDIANKDLYYGFGRTSLPDLTGVVWTYRRSKLTYGVHAGFDVKSKEFGKAKLKFGEEYSQPFAHRIFWALGFNTIPVDCVPTVKVKWDRRILTEFNTRKDQILTVKLVGIFPIHREHLQHYIDPLQPVSEVIMRDEYGKESSVKPNPNWEEFKRNLYKNPIGRPEEIKDNFNIPFADRIEFLIYKNVNFRTIEGDGEDDQAEGEVFLGNWDWDGEGNPGIRENRSMAFISAWLNQFDARTSNNKISLLKQNGKRTFKHYVTDLGACLGRADDAPRMDSQQPNEFPWSFTRPARKGDTAIPLDGSFHPVRKNDAFKAADIYDARWIAPHLAQITGKQILEALVASGLPSAKVRLYFNKLVHRRNKALTDLGLDFPSIKPLDEGEEFDYDPQKDGLISIITSRNETVTAPDEDWVVVKGRVYTRAEVSSGAAARDIAKNIKIKSNKH